ncbi:VWA domain-containing protein [archaeon]|nr:VWA domain-containing protein [archaeon]
MGVNFTFVSPEYLWFLFVLPFLIFLHFYTLRFVKKKAVKFANFDAIARVTGEQLLSKNIGLLVIRLIIITFIVLAVSGTIMWYEGQSSNYDVVLAIDASQSMLADDYDPNRLEAAKDAAILYIDNLKGETGIGIVSFSGASYIHQQLTTDPNKAKKAIQNISVQGLGGTNIGDAIITSSNLLITSKRPKVIILLTDGRANVGTQPAEAINYLISEGMVVNTIGVGTEEGGVFTDGGILSTLDEDTLQKIAEDTKGTYFRAENEERLREAYENINIFSEKRLSKDLSGLFMVLAFIFLLGEWILISTRYRTIP